MSINQFILDGNLTRAPEVRTTPSGLPVCTFTVASNTVHGSGEDRREVVAFIPVTTLGRLAQASAQHLRKGAGVTVMGRLASWYDAEAKKGGFAFEAERVIFRQRAARAPDGDVVATGAPGAPGAALAAGPSHEPDPHWVQAFEDASQALARNH